MSETLNNSTGTTLRATREKLGLSINDVALATKINPRILKAIEEGHREQLPAKSFARGFIRTYANYLKIDPKPLLASFDGSAEAPANLVKNEATADNEAEEFAPKAEATTAATMAAAAATKKNNSAFSEARSPSRVLLIGAMFILVVLIIGIKKIADKYAHERAIDVTPAKVAPIVNPLDGSAQAPTNPSPVDSSGLVLSPGTSPTTDTAAAGAVANSAIEKTADAADDSDDEIETVEAPAPPVPVVAAPAPPPTAAKPPTPTSVLPNTGLEVSKNPLPKIKAPEAPKPSEPIKAQEAPKKVEAAATSEPAKAATPSKPQEVIIEALDSVEITVFVDGDPAKTLKLSPESIHTIKAKSQIELQIADGGMVNLIHNGHEKGVPGVLGKPVKVKFP